MVSGKCCEDRLSLQGTTWLHDKFIYDACRRYRWKAHGASVPCHCMNSTNCVVCWLNIAAGETSGRQTMLSSLVVDVAREALQYPSVSAKWSGAFSLQSLCITNMTLSLSHRYVHCTALIAQCKQVRSEGALHMRRGTGQVPAAWGAGMHKVSPASNCLNSSSDRRSILAPAPAWDACEAVDTLRIH